MGKCSGSLSENAEKLKLTLSSPENPRIKLEMDAKQVDELIALLIRLRADMYPPVPEALPNTMIFRGVRDPAGYLETDRLGDCVLLHLRHPGIGWVHFGFPLGKARAIAEHMRERAETALAVRAKARRN
jgi:hypothetical protein